MNLKSLLKGYITQKELLNYYNATIIYENLPSEINGCVFSYDNLYFILIDKCLSYYKKRKTILHELAHIELHQLRQIDNDLFSTKVDEYEDEADKYVKYLLDIIKLD